MVKVVKKETGAAVLVLILAQNRGKRVNANLKLLTTRGVFIILILIPFMHT